MVERYGFAPIPITRWHDTQAVCAYHALPLDLDRALKALGSEVEKDRAGRLFTLSLSRPKRGTGEYPEITPATLERVAPYNHTDVGGVVTIDTVLGRLPKRERRVWELDQTINQRGVGIDLDYVHAAKDLADQLIAKECAEFLELTGRLRPTQVQATQDWVTKQGLSIPDLTAETIEEALQREDLSKEVRRVLEIRSVVGSSSLKKLDSMLACTGSDGRARGLLQYHGATPGRWTGRLLQPQNFPRPTIEVDDPEELVAAIKTRDLGALRPWGEPVEVLVSSLRHAIIGQDDALLGAGDFSMIEPRITLALAGQDDKVALLDDGADVYRDVAADIYRLDKLAFMAIAKDQLTPEQNEQRQIGKGTIIGCGFGLGWPTFHQLHCPHMSEEFAQKVIDTYRNVWAPRVPFLWLDLERAALRAMFNPGKVSEADCGIQYRLETKAGLPFLVCKLFNGKKFHYCNAGVEERQTKWGSTRTSITYWAMKDHHWRKVVAWHGHLTENVVQALARERLVDAMFRFEERGYPVILTVHDEIVVEHPSITEAIVKEIMAEQPQWAVGLGVPIAVEAWTGKRYRK